MSFEYIDDVCLLLYIIEVINEKLLENKEVKGYLKFHNNFCKMVFSQILKNMLYKTIPLKKRLGTTQGAALLR